MVGLLLSAAATFAVAATVFLGGVLAPPAWRQRANWRAREATCVVCAFALWFSLELAQGNQKSLSNVALEPVLLALATGLLTLLRVALGPRVSAPPKRWGFLGLSLLSGILLAYLVKALPE